MTATLAPSAFDELAEIAGRLDPHGPAQRIASHLARESAKPLGAWVSIDARISALHDALIALWDYADSHNMTHNFQFNGAWTAAMMAAVRQGILDLRTE